MNFKTIFIRALKLCVFPILSFFLYHCSSDHKEDTGDREGIAKREHIGNSNLSKNNQNNDALKPSSKNSPICEGSIAEVKTQLCTSKDMSWLYEAETKDSHIRIINDELIWVQGIWKSGQWYGDLWENGVWEDGIWHQGVWKSGSWKKGYWRNGIWLSGVWQNGTWAGGSWEAGTWIKGYWRGGVWQNGLWQNGTWHKGTWNGGTWEDGIWWCHGVWNGGNWIKGTLYWWIPDKPGSYRMLTTSSHPSIACPS